MRFKVNEFTFRGGKICYFHWCLPYKFGSFHKGKKLLPSEQILSFFRETSSCRKLSPFKNMAEKMEVY